MDCMAWMSWRMFGVPRGWLGRLGARILGAHGKRTLVRRALAVLQVERGDSVLEIGFGPGVGISEAAARVGSKGFVAGIDPSDVMLEEATRRNPAAIRRGIVELRLANVSRLPYPAARFDKAFAMYTADLWPDTVGGLREVRRTLKPRARLLLTSHAGTGPPPARTLQELRGAGFARPEVRTWRGTILIVAEA